MARLRPEGAPVGEVLRRLEDSLEFLVVEWQRRPMRDLRRLQRHGGVGVKPSGVLAEPKKAAEVFEALHRRERRVRPAVAERAECGDVEVLQQAEALVVTEGQELPLEQFSTLPDGGLSQVAGHGVVEVQLDRPLDRRHLLLMTPISPDASQPWTIADAALQSRVFRDRFTQSPPSEPWTQMPHLRRVHARLFARCGQLRACHRQRVRLPAGMGRLFEQRYRKRHPVLCQQRRFL